MKKKIKKITILTVAILSLLVGVFGLALPLLPGVIFLLIGFLLFSLYYPKTRLWINKHLEKYPHLFSVIEKIEKWLVKTIGEI